MNTASKKSCKIYETALYLRLSRDDVDIDGNSKTESNSISNQRELLRSYVRNHEDLQIYDIYVDDGYSGSNFDRPEFKRMMDDVYAGKVNCVIVKDLSRFGREYIEAGRFIEKIFPALNIRFIAIIDNYDSNTADRMETSLILPVKNFVNDSYCRDISQKVRSNKEAKRKDGKFIGAFTVYGYAKDPEQHNHLIVDDYAAEIVKTIYALKISGLSMNAIAKRLNLQHILSPQEYKKSQGMNFKSGFGNGVESKWTFTAIRRILTDEIYLGHMVQGKRERISYKVKKEILKPENEWVKVESTHEPIITQSDFEVVQRLLKYDGRSSKNSEAGNLFTGILLCGDCKAPMIRRVNKYKETERVFYICQTKNKSQGCSRHSILEETLKEIVLKEIKFYTSIFMDYQKVIEELKNMEVSYEQVVGYDTQIAQMQEEYNKYYRLKNSLYDDLRDGIISKQEFEEYRGVYGEKCIAVMDSIKGQKEIIKELFKNGVSATVQLEQWKKSLDLQTLDRALLVTAVQNIFVYEDKRLEIQLRYKNVIAKLAVISNFLKDYPFKEVQ